MNKFCPFCNTKIEISLVRHIKAEHGEEALRKALIEEKRKGTPDAQIGDKYGISFSYLERVITQEFSYSANVVEGDLSTLSVPEFIAEMQKVARESYRVLKPGRQCAILIGDTRKAEYINFAYESPNSR